MSGQWPQSFSTVQDVNGKPIVGALAYFFAAGTTTPIEVYKDYTMATTHPNPVTTDGYGRFPAVFLDEEDQFYRVRVTAPTGSILYDSDTLPIVGPSDGGGGTPTPPVDPDALVKTGDLKARYGEGFLSGFVRCNGRTIGTATSGATERANSDAQALYIFLWGADPNLEVAGGRGANGLADWSANKPLTLPDFRGRALVGLDDMGNTAAGLLTDATDLGWKGGQQSVTLTINQMPSHNHTASSSTDGAHSHRLERGGTGGGDYPQTGTLPTSGTIGTSTDGAHSHAITVNSRGGGQAHSNVQPSMAVTIYIRL